MLQFLHWFEVSIRKKDSLIGTHRNPSQSTINKNLRLKAFFIHSSVRNLEVAKNAWQPKKAGEAKQLGIDLFASTYMNFFLVHSSKENNLKQQSSLLDSKHPLHSNRIHDHCWPFSTSLKIQSVFNALIIYMTFNPFRDSEFGNGNGPGKWAKKSFLC